MAYNKYKKPAPRPGGPKHAEPYWLVGIHPVQMALRNPTRNYGQLLATRNAAAKLQVPFEPTIVDRRHIDHELPKDTLHQGVALKVEPIRQPDLADLIAEGKPLLLMDKVTDPHNVGAIMRSAAAFGIGGIVTQMRYSPPENATLAKTAAGALELVPYLREGNLSNAMQQLRDAGYHITGLAGETDMDLHNMQRPDQPIALVVGAEGAGLREKTRGLCDQLVRIPIQPAMESLNVSVATAIALYALQTK